MTLKEMRELRAKKIKDARAIINAADSEKRSMTDDEKAKYDKLFSEADELRSSIEREERQQEAERELEQELGEEGEQRGGDQGENRGLNEALIGSFRSWLSGGEAAATEEFRNLSAGIDTEGGFLVPDVFINKLIKALDDAVIVRQLAHVIPMTNAGSIGNPTLDSDMEDADWTTELQTGREDGGLKLGKRVMVPHPMAKRIKVSLQLMRVAALSPESLVRSRMVYKFGITQEKAYLLGDGDKKPLGLFMPSNDGIPVSRDVDEDNTSDKVTADGLISAKFSLKTGHLNNSNWLFHRDIVKEIAKLKDAQGQYIWRESVREGEPDRLLGRPLRTSEFAPNTLAANQYVGLLGNFDHYWILDSLQMQIQRLMELYAEKGQIGFIGRYEGDGAPVLPEAFARVKLKAA